MLTEADRLRMKMQNEVEEIEASLMGSLHDGALRVGVDPLDSEWLQFIGHAFGEGLSIQLYHSYVQDRREGEENR